MAKSPYSSAGGGNADANPYSEARSSGGSVKSPKPKKGDKKPSKGHR